MLWKINNSANKMKLCQFNQNYFIKEMKIIKDHSIK